MKIPQSTWISSKILIRRSPIHGNGMFATVNIQKNETLIVWGGCYTDTKNALALQRQGIKTMQWDEDVFSYETKDDLAYFAINHSCDPNAWMSDAFTVTARRRIHKGEEITADYALWISDITYIASWECCCGSEVCRGRITGNDWKIKTLQQRYSGHFSPLITAWIRNMCMDSA